MKISNSVLKKSFSESNVEKLYKNIFVCSENINENIKRCPLENDFINNLSKKVYDSTKENIHTFPTILKRINDIYSLEKAVYTIFRPNETVSLNLFSIENVQHFFFLLKIDTTQNKELLLNSKYQSRDVLKFECVIDKIQLPTIYKVLTEDSPIILNKTISKALKVSSDLEKKSVLYPKQHIKGTKEYLTDAVFKNASNRIIIHVKAET